MPVLMLKHGDFFANLFVAAATVPREGFAEYFCEAETIG